MNKHYLTNLIKRSILLVFAFFTFIFSNAQDFKTQKIVSCSAGKNFSLAVDGLGNLWAWGDNEWGQLGDGTKISKNSPIIIKPETKFKIVSSGVYHVLAIDEYGNLWAWGLGNLGIGAYSVIRTPIQINTGTKFKSVSAGSSHTLAIDVNGNLWAWGSNRYGQLGDGTNLEKLVPVQIKSGTKFKNISAGSDYSLAIDESNNLWAWGGNSYGQLGTGSYSSQNSPILIENGVKFKAISAGVTENVYTSSFAIDESGNLWAWGCNYSGQLGDGTTNSSKAPVIIKEGTKFNSVSTGAEHVLAIDELGYLWAWGNNGKGRLGNGTVDNSSIPVNIKPGSKFESVSAGSSHSIAIDDLGNLFVWGSNLAGLLGDGTIPNKLVPVNIGQNTTFKLVSAGCSHSLAIDVTGNLWAWGDNSSGQLGDGTSSDKSLPVQIKTGTKFQLVSAGGAQSFAIDEAGNLWAWGDNYFGELGDGTTKNKLTPVQISPGIKFKAISTGVKHTLAIDEAGNLWSWGRNIDGQLGNSSTSDTKTPGKIKTDTKFKYVSAGDDFSIVVDDQGNIWTFGYNYFGQIGNGLSSSDSNSKPLLIQKDTKFQLVSAGYSHSMAIDESGNLWGWGYNTNSQVSNSGGTNIKTPMQVKWGSKLKSVSAGGYYTLTIDEFGFLWSWGYNNYGTLGNGTTTDKSTPEKIKSDTKFQIISAGKRHALAIDLSGKLWTWGTNEFGQLGDGTAWYASPLWLNTNNPIVYVEGISLTKNNIKIKNYTSVQLAATISPSNASNKRVTWSSSDTSIVTVSATGLVSAVANGSATITATSADGGKTVSCELTVFTPVSYISLSKTDTYIIKGLTTQLTATISPEDASNKLITWSSSNDSIAMVDSTGLVTALNSGTITISVTSADGAFIAHCNVAVVSFVSGITLSSSVLSVQKDSTTQLVATLYPSDATNKKISWKSSDESVATVNSTGLVTALLPGTTTITAKTADGGKIATCVVTVISSVTSITLSSESISFQKYLTSQLTAIVLPSDATNKTITWASSDESIAKVDSMGLVTGVKSGTATITATTADGGKIANCEVTVLAGLSVLQSENGTQLMVYPNPLKDGLLNIHLNEQINDADLTIFNVTGQLVYSGFLRTKETVQLEYKTFNPGLYLIKVSNKEMNGVRKILVE